MLFWYLFEHRNRLVCVYHMRSPQQQTVMNGGELLNLGRERNAGLSSASLRKPVLEKLTRIMCLCLLAIDVFFLVFTARAQGDYKVVKSAFGVGQPQDSEDAKNNIKSIEMADPQIE